MHTPTTTTPNIQNIQNSNLPLPHYQNPQHGQCPSCGRCYCCGQPYPYWNTYPQVTWGGTTGVATSPVTSGYIQQVNELYGGLDAVRET